MGIKAIFVDLGGVLIINKAKEVGEKFEKEHGLKPTDIQDVFRYIQTGNRTEEEVDSYLAGKGLARELWDSFTKDFYNSERRNDSLYGILEEAHIRGILIVFTSNNSAGLESVIDKFRIRDVADIIINSSALAVAKPDAGFWQRSLEETRKLRPDISPAEILVVDDSEVNCASARDFGFSVICYTGEDSHPEISGMLT